VADALLKRHVIRFTYRSHSTGQKTYRVADFREIKLKILQFAADVEVVSPEELCREVQKEIESMAKIYK
jgi:predicted DNA-binding transcriptional regulator YafY